MNEEPYCDPFVMDNYREIDVGNGKVEYECKVCGYRIKQNTCWIEAKLHWKLCEPKETESLRDSFIVPSCFKHYEKNVFCGACRSKDSCRKYSPVSH